MDSHTDTTETCYHIGVLLSGNNIISCAHFTHRYTFSAAHRALKQSQSAPTPSQASELGCAVGTVPSVPRKLAPALLSPTQRAHLHAPRIGEIGLRERQRQFVGLFKSCFLILDLSW